MRAGALVVADALDREIVAADRAGVQDLRRGAALQGRQVPGQLHFILRADDQVDTLHLLQDVRAGLGVAAGDRHKGIRRGAADLADEVPALGLRVVGHGAGVEDDEVGGPAELDQVVPAAAELVSEEGRLGLVQAAPDRMQ